MSGNNMPVYHTNSPQKTQCQAKELAATYVGGDVICLQGELGAGKTTFAQALLEYFDAPGPYTSPTFSIVKEYSLPTPLQNISTIFHIDLYRIGPEDLELIGWHDMMTRSEALTIVEWPERAHGYIPDRAVYITFTVKEKDVRDITVSFNT
jgi:tRNA threonylcarbamoyladenosine biosynthesis protein TsaE